MAKKAFGDAIPGEPLFIFYDCETTGLKIGWDRIIEIGAVVHPGHKVSHRSFDRLCCSTREICPEAQALTGLTDDDLKGKPSVKDVLYEFFDWINQTVREVREREGKAHVPVLAAHSGSQFDFPMLFEAVGGIGRRGRDNALQRKFNALSLHYVDTFVVLRTLKSSGMCELQKLGLTDIYKAYFGDRAGAHRALNDAKDLCKIFTESPQAGMFMSMLREFIQSKDGLEITKTQVNCFLQFNKLVFKPCEATKLLERGLTYEDFVEKSRESYDLFCSFIRDCGITEPSLIEDTARGFKYGRLSKEEKEWLSTMDQIDKFLQVKKTILKPHKVIQLLRKGITYEAVVAKSGSSEVDFRCFLETECGITGSDLDDLMREFRNL